MDDYLKNKKATIKLWTELEEKLEPLIRANKLKREPKHLTMAKNIIFGRDNHYEVKGD